MPISFRNTELIYSDGIGEAVAQVGFKTILCEGAKQSLGWKSPDYVYCNAIEPRLKVLARNYHMSDDIALRFGNQSWSEWPLTAQKFKSWADGLDGNEEVLNLFMNYETFGVNQSQESGILEFLGALPEVFLGDKNYAFMTPSKSSQMQPISAIHVPSATCWVDEERDLTAWLGNEMQNEAVDKLYALAPLMEKCQDEALQKDWQYLQASDHFYYMGTKFFANGAHNTYANPYQTPYEAFINYMNVLSDFAQRLHQAVPDSDSEIENLKAQNSQLRSEVTTLEKQLVKAGVEAPKKTTARKTTSTARKTATKKPKSE